MFHWNTKLQQKENTLPRSLIDKFSSIFPYTDIAVDMSVDDDVDSQAPFLSDIGFVAVKEIPNKK